MDGKSQRLLPLLAREGSFTPVTQRVHGMRAGGRRALGSERLRSPSRAKAFPAAGFAVPGSLCEALASSCIHKDEDVLLRGFIWGRLPGP